MDYPLCERCGWNPTIIQDRLRLLGLDQADIEQQGQELQRSVITPNVSSIVDSFNGSLTRLKEFKRIASEPATVSRLRALQKDYLLGMGIGFRERKYFEERLRVGDIHHRMGVPQSSYHCTFQGLQSLLIDNIPNFIKDDASAFEEMLRFILKITALDMMLAMESYCSASVSSLEKSLARERDKSEQLHRLAVTDWLTNLRNHSYSRRYLETALQHAKDSGSSLCVIMADLDRFKKVNDRHGHLVGDQVLQIAAARMLSAARTGDEICRYGGEEFLMILQETNLREGTEVAERVRVRINSDAMQSGGARITLSMSLGLAEARRSDTVNSLIERADEALYIAKRAGRNCVRVK